MAERKTLREQEDGIFEQTRRYLDEVEGARLSIVMDELHLARGEGETQRRLRPIFVGARGERIAAAWPANVGPS